LERGVVDIVEALNPTVWIRSFLFQQIYETIAIKKRSNSIPDKPAPEGRCNPWPKQLMYYPAVSKEIHSR